MNQKQAVATSEREKSEEKEEAMYKSERYI